MRLSPKDFWAMTPRELAVVLGLTRPAPVAPGRTQLAVLMRAFPDEKE
ncbi:phage tail assembly chaperone [Shinella daejeonensis]|nr:phage tail assembly chaperone [Shinella daejeonensis]